MSSNINWRRWRSWLIGITIFLTGIALILSDRIAARATHRPWIVPLTPIASYLRDAESKPVIGEQWPKAISEIVLTYVRFSDSPLKDVLRQIQDETSVQLVINWHILTSFGISEQSNFWFTGKNDVPLTALLDALVEGISRKAPKHPQLVWKAQPGRVIYITTVQELSRDRLCHTQRMENASAELRKKLDRQIPYVRLEDLTLDEALRYFQRISGVKVRLQEPGYSGSDITTIIAQDITVEEAFESLIRHTKGTSGGTWHFLAEADDLLLVRDKGND